MGAAVLRERERARGEWRQGMGMGRAQSSQHARSIAERSFIGSKSVRVLRIGERWSTCHALTHVKRHPPNGNLATGASCLRWSVDREGLGRLGRQCTSEDVAGLCDSTSVAALECIGEAGPDGILDCTPSRALAA